MRHRSYLPARLLILALLAFLPLLALGGGSTATATTPQSSVVTPQLSVLIFRVYFNSFAERNWLANEFGADEHQTTGGYLTYTADQALHDTIKALGYRVEIDHEATREANMVINTPPSAPGTFFGGYRTVEEMQAFLDAKVAAYPNLVEKIDVGDSWCKTHPGQCTQPDVWNGYDLWVLRITNRSIPGPKPIFWYDSGIHSREIATPETSMRFIDHLLNGYASDADAHWLVDHHEIYVMPMLNPDGHHIVENGANQPRPQRKNADNDDGCTTFLSLGTDLNRNFPFLWGCCGGSSGSACSETFRGIAAASEEETQAIVAKQRQLFPDQRGPNNTDAAPLTTTGIIQSMHSVANLNLYPWGWTNSGAPNSTDLGNIARHMSATNAYPPGNNYQACQPGLCLYNVDGDTFDWQYGELGVPGYTTELHGGTFYPPYAQVEGIYTTNRGQLLYMAKIARTPYLTTRGPDAVSPVTNPMTTTQGTPVNLNATINYTWAANSYVQNVGGAEYYINTPPWAGGTPLPMQAVDGAFDEQNEPVQAVIDTTAIPPGTYVVFVRGRGVNNYEGLGSWGPMSATWLVITAGGPTATPTVSCTTGTTDVSIIDNAFEPPVVTIRAGSTIRWTNNGQLPHTSTSTTAVWDSGTLNNGQQFSFTFNTPGSYPYICTIHPAMTGTIVVLSGCATNTVQPTVTRTLTVPPSVTRTSTLPPSVTRTSTLPPTNTVTVLPTFTGTPTHTPTTGPSATGTPPTPTNTVPVPPSSTSTVTVPVPPSSTGTVTVPVPPTFTVGIPTATEPAATATTGTPGPATATPTVCSVTFSDVPPEDTFYLFIRCLACREIIGGYVDGTFRPNNNITRGQIAKMVSNSAGFQEPVDGQTYEDVPFGSPFYVFIERLSNRGHMGGYPCGLRDTEPCVPPANRPYFRPNENATRGQISKIVSNAANIQDPVTGIFYTDVTEDNPFYLEIMRLTNRFVMSGYPCGGINPQTGQPEPCDTEQRPYFRWGNFVTRGQASKIVANTFFPGCEAP